MFRVSPTHSCFRVHAFFACNKLVLPGGRKPRSPLDHLRVLLDTIIIPSRHSLFLQDGADFKFKSAVVRQTVRVASKCLASPSHDFNVGRPRPGVLAPFEISEHKLLRES